MAPFWAKSWVRAWLWVNAACQFFATWAEKLTKWVGTSNFYVLALTTHLGRPMLNSFFFKDLSC